MGVRWPTAGTMSPWTATRVSRKVVVGNNTCQATHSSVGLHVYRA